MELSEADVAALIAYQQIENVILTPKVFKQTMDLQRTTSRPFSRRTGGEPICRISTSKTDRCVVIAVS